MSVKECGEIILTQFLFGWKKKNGPLNVEDKALEFIFTNLLPLSEPQHQQTSFQKWHTYTHMMEWNGKHGGDTADKTLCYLLSSPEAFGCSVRATNVQDHGVLPFKRTRGLPGFRKTFERYWGLSLNFLFKPDPFPEWRTYTEAEELSTRQDVDVCGKGRTWSAAEPRLALRNSHLRLKCKYCKVVSTGRDWSTFQPASRSDNGCTYVLHWKFEQNGSFWQIFWVAWPTLYTFDHHAIDPEIQLNPYLPVIYAQVTGSLISRVVCQGQVKNNFTQCNLHRGK